MRIEGTKTQNKKKRNPLWLSDIESEHNLMTAINVTINNDDRSRDSNHREYSVIWLITERVCASVRACAFVCVGTWICHISSFAELQCYIRGERKREGDREREKEIETRGSRGDRERALLGGSSG